MWFKKEEELEESEVSLPQLPRVEILWLDAWTDEAHLNLNDMADFQPAERQNIGYIVEADDEKLIITTGLMNNVVEDKTFVDGLQVIPWGMVKEVIELD